MSDRRAGSALYEQAALLLAQAKHVGFVLIAGLVFHTPSTPMDTNAAKCYSYVLAARNNQHKYNNYLSLV
jgi:hypothetical protein